MAAVVAGNVKHFQGSPGEVGWSCGYKNIQMQISHLLERDKVNTALFIPTPSCRMQYLCLPLAGSSSHEDCSVPVRSGTPRVSRES